MPPRLNLFTAGKAVPALRQPCTSRRNIVTSLSINRPNAGGYGLKPTISSTGRLQRRLNSTGSGSNDDPSRMKGPTEDALPHVSEEAAETAKIMGKKGKAVSSSPELEQGTPVSEILKRDQNAQKHAPKVMQDQMNKGQKRPFSTSARRLQLDAQSDASPAADPTVAIVADMISQTSENAAELNPGLKFPAPESLPRTENFRKRYDTLLEQFTKLMMQDGKLSVAQKNMAFILDHLRTSSPPQPHAKRSLLPGPPGPQLPLNPVLYLTLLVDSVAPLLKIQNLKGLVGGGGSLQIPSPLKLRQRRRQAITWILNASDKRKDTKFAQRVAHELVAVAEGRSGVWEKREAVHRLATTTRSNLALAVTLQAMKR